MNNPRNLALGAAGVAALLYFTPGNPFNTPAVKMVGEAHAKGGALPTHSPAIATPRGETGSLDNNTKHESKGGTATDHFQDNVASQSGGEPGPIKGMFNEAMTGSKRGKPSEESPTGPRSKETVK